MPKLPILSGLKVVKALTKNGFALRGREGSHVILVKDKQLVLVPMHKELSRFVLTNIIRQTGMTKGAFLAFFE